MVNAEQLNRKQEKKEEQKKPLEKVSGFIDNVNAAHVSGWAYDPNIEQGEATIASIRNEAGSVYAQGKAEIFREDLVKSNVGTGYHGFQLMVDDRIRLHDNEPVFLYVNGKKVESSSCQVNAFAPELSVSLGGIVDRNILFHVNNSGGNREFTFSAYVGEKNFFLNTIEAPAGQFKISVPVPDYLFDNEAHLFSFGVVGSWTSLWTDYLSFNSVITPWEYLKKSYKISGLASLNKQAKFRYESLNLNIESIEDGVNKLQKVKDVLTAHQVVVEGWEGRKQFPVLKLPKNRAKPQVSIIIPAYNNFALTYHCIASIILSYNKLSYEVLVADDCSDDETSDIEKYIQNVVHIRNHENLRFLKSCNNAAKHVNGDYIVFLNNDTEVTSRWLDELLFGHQYHENIGATGSKLLNLDGSLQDAGGIIWGNGQPWNVGNGQNPERPEFNYNRQAHYLTGAALCVPVKVWNEVGGFSEELAPCYYEDTDIAFKIREKGYKTMYCPFSQVIHFEGKSHGRDVKKGLKKYQVVNESKFRSKWYKQYKNFAQVGTDLMLNKDLDVDHRILVIDYATPDSNADAGSYAAIKEIELLQELGLKVTFVPQNMAYMGILTKKLQRMGVEVLYAPFYLSVEEVIDRRINEFSAVYITRYSVAEQYVDKIKSISNIKIVFNNADLHFLRELRASQTTGEYTVDQAVNTREKELGVMRKVDTVLSYNETEHAVILSHNLNGDNIFKCPWVLDKKDVDFKKYSFSKRDGIAFLGGFRHHPNVEAVKFFAKEVMPVIVNANPEIKFFIYGSNPNEEVLNLASENIIVKGFVENLDDVFLNHKVIIAPLLSGAGIKGKVLEAMSYGTPQVLTSVAIEATGLSHKVSAWICNEPLEMAEGVLEIYSNKEVWCRLSENSKLIAEEVFSQEKGIKQMKEVFKFLDIYL